MFNAEMTNYYCGEYESLHYILSTFFFHCFIMAIFDTYSYIMFLIAVLVRR